MSVVAVIAPAGEAAKPAVTITQIKGFADGYNAGSGMCTFHVTVTYTTAGHISSRLNSQLYKASAGAIGTNAWGAIGTSPWTSELMYVAPTWVSAGGSDYAFVVRTLSKSGKVLETHTTDVFTVNGAANDVHGCPVASTTPLVTTNF